MRAEIVEHYPDAVRIQVVLIRKLLQSVDELAPASSRRDRDVSPASERFDGDGVY